MNIVDEILVDEYVGWLMDREMDGENQELLVEVSRLKEVMND